VPVGRRPGHTASGVRLDPVPGEFPRHGHGPPGDLGRRARPVLGRGLRARRRPAPLRAAGDRRRRRGDRGAGGGDLPRGRRSGGRPRGPGLARAVGAGLGQLRLAFQRAVLAGPGRLGEGHRQGVRAVAARRRVRRAQPRRGARGHPRPVLLLGRAGQQPGARCPRSCTSSSSASATAGRRAPGWTSSPSSTAGTAATTTGGCAT
jgi:hypothetical protein